MTAAEVLRALKKAGTAQTRKTYARHGAIGPMFGVSFATLKLLQKRIGVDQELARALWKSGNFDARTLALKIADPARTTRADLDRWVREGRSRFHAPYVAMLASEGAQAGPTAGRWLAAEGEIVRVAGWALAGQLALRGESTPDAWFAALLARIGKQIHAAPNEERAAMNLALIQIGGRSSALRKAATAVAKRIGTVDVDHGDTACKSPEAVAYLEKMWSHAKAKGFATPAAQERAREVPRCRC